jgi:GAF domain-containing protein
VLNAAFSCTFGVALLRGGNLDTYPLASETPKVRIFSSWYQLQETGAELGPQHRLLEQNNTTTRSPQRISAALAAAQAHSALAAAAVRFPGEDGGQSLGEIAQRDLDAALQLLADRAQYITGASGAAIALRRDGMADMLCRASTGTNAPELGALLSTEFGLSGESVRTKRALRCDDAERDARVNREVCRQLGIASVVVMPVVNDDQVLGVFELFSGRAHAFGDRDLSAIQRLSQMVETAVRLAQASESLPKKLAEAGNAASKIAGPGVREGQFVSDLVVDAAKLGEAAASAEAAPASGPNLPAAEALTVQPAVEKVANPASGSIIPPKKPLFWSATVSSESETLHSADETDQSHVPPMLRQLRKCEACGFPVSAGRTLCVECEEKKWRGQLRPQAARSVGSSASASSSSKTGINASAAAAPSMARMPSISSDPTEIGVANRTQLASDKIEPAKIPNEVTADIKPAAAVATTSEQTSQTHQASAPEFVLSAGAAPSQSWLSANKYILLVLLVIAAAAAAVFYLR